MKTKRTIGLWTGITATVLLLVAAGCDAKSFAALADQAPDTPPAHVDSVFTFEEELQRFQNGLGEPVRALSGGATSREEVAEMLLEALESSDRARLAEITVSIQEFGYLYYPESRFARTPYRLSPHLLWFQMENASETGLRRALDRFGGRKLTLDGLVCDPVPEIAGENRLWSGCTLRVRPGRGEAAVAPQLREGLLDLSLFSGILEREGRFKIFGFGNRL